MNRPPARGRAAAADNVVTTTRTITSIRAPVTRYRRLRRRRRQYSFSSVLPVVYIVLTLACGSPVDDRPTVPGPLEYWTAPVDLPGCAVRLPPVHDVPRCSPDEIGTRIDSGEICRLLTGLRDWAGPAGWSLVRASCVRDTLASWPHRPGQVSKRVLSLYVDVPARSEVWFAQQTDGEPVDYFVSPR